MRSIPKIAHLVWFGDQSMPMINVFTIISFHRLNPDWKIKVYTSKQGNKDFGTLEWIPPYIGDDCFPLIRAMEFVQIIEVDLKDFDCPVQAHVIAMTDVFRQQVLFKYGGIYSDFDVIWLRPMDYFTQLDCLGDPKDFQCSISFYNLTDGHHNVSNIVAEKGNKFMEFTLSKCAEVEAPYSHQAFGTDMFNRLFPKQKNIEQQFERMLYLRYETFFPYGIYNLIDLFQRDDITPAYADNVMAVHWFGGHPYAHAYIDGNGFERKCSMTSILKKEGLI